MTSRGRGIRSRKVEAPRPRRQLSSQPVETNTETLGDVEYMMIDKLLAQLEAGKLSPSEANSLNMALKNSGEALRKSDTAYIERVLSCLRRCLKLSSTLCPTTRLYLLEILELGARNWQTKAASERYYEKKYQEFNIRQRITRTLGGEKSLERGGLPMRSLSYDPDTVTTNGPMVNGLSPKPSKENSSTSPKDTWSGLRRLSRVPYESGKGVLAFDIAIPKAKYCYVMGSAESNVHQIQRLSDTRILADKEGTNVECCKFTIQGPGENSIKKAVAMFEHLLDTGDVVEKCFKPSTDSPSIRAVSSSSTNSEVRTSENTDHEASLPIDHDQYETASEGDVFSRQNSLQNNYLMKAAACDIKPCSSPLEQDFLESRESTSFSLDRRLSSTDDIHAATCTTMHSNSVSSPLSPSALTANFNSESQSKKSVTSPKQATPIANRSLSNGRSPGEVSLGNDDSEVSDATPSPPVTKLRHTMSPGVKRLKHIKANMVYSIPINEHILDLSCTDEEILKEAVEVLRSHFLPDINSNLSSSRQNSITLSFDPSNNNNNSSSMKPLTGLCNPSLTPLPDSDEDVVWTEQDEDCLMMQEVEDTISDLMIRRGKGKRLQIDTKNSDISLQETDEPRQATSTPYPSQDPDEARLATSTPYPTLQDSTNTAPATEDTKQATSTPYPTEDTPKDVSAIPLPIDVSQIPLPEPKLAFDVSSIAVAPKTLTTPSSNVLNRAFVSTNETFEAVPRAVTPEIDSKRTRSCVSEPSLDLESLVRQDHEGPTYTHSHSLDGSSRLSQNSLSDSRPGSYHRQSRFDQYGYSQPSNIRRHPLNPLASTADVKRAEMDSKPGAEGSAARRRYFAATSQRFHEIKYQTEVRGQKVLQYGQNFLLACSRSPLSRQPPSDWAISTELPDVCLSQHLGFTPSLVNWSVECIPIKGAKW